MVIYVNAVLINAIRHERIDLVSTILPYRERTASGALSSAHLPIGKCSVTIKRLLFTQYSKVRVRGVKYLFN